MTGTDFLMDGPEGKLLSKDQCQYAGNDNEQKCAVVYHAVKYIAEGAGDTFFRAEQL